MFMPDTRNLRTSRYTLLVQGILRLFGSMDLAITLLLILAVAGTAIATVVCCSGQCPTNVFEVIIESSIIDSNTTKRIFWKNWKIETKYAWAKVFGVIIDSGVNNGV